MRFVVKLMLAQGVFSVGLTRMDKATGDACTDEMTGEVGHEFAAAFGQQDADQPLPRFTSDEVSEAWQMAENGDFDQPAKPADNTGQTSASSTSKKRKADPPIKNVRSKKKQPNARASTGSPKYLDRVRYDRRRAKNYKCEQCSADTRHRAWGIFNGKLLCDTCQNSRVEAFREQLKRMHEKIKQF